jgi:uncharacterized protein YndB with AHSA1/START domain
MIEAESTLRIDRVFAAPRERVWSAWTEPERLARWWWPERFGTTYEVDLREGGAFRFHTLDLPPMGVLAVTGRFLEVRPPERLVYTWRWENEEHESRVTVELRDVGGHTALGILHEGLPGAEERDNHVTGWNDCLDRLEELLI